MLPMHHHDDAFLSFMVPFVWESVLLLMCFQTFATLLAQCVVQSREQNRASIYIEEIYIQQVFSSLKQIVIP